MKEQNPIDDLFRRELEDYRVTPSAERRAALMGETGRPGFSKPWWILGIIAVILVGVGVTVFVSRESRVVNRESIAVSRDPRSGMQDAGSRMQNATTSSNPVTQQPSNPATQLPSNPVTQQPSNPAAQSPSHPVTQSPSHPVTQTSRIQNPASSNPTPNPQSLIPPALASSSNPASQAPVGAGSREPGAVSREPGTRMQDAGSTMQDVKSSSIPQPESSNLETKPSSIVQPAYSNPAIQPSSNPVTQQPSNPATQRPDTVHRTSYIVHPDKDLPPKNWHISLDAYYSPEWMFNTLNGDKFVNNAGVEGTFHFGRYSIRTGVGLSITTGSNEMVVESNEYLGAYPALDSITFDWDYSNYKLVPTYYTTGTKVYDTSLQYTYTNNKKRYTYLQIPLVLGYDFWQNNWFSLGVRGGAVMSLLLKSQELSDTYNPGQSRVVTINNVSPDRVQLNWQAMAGINAAFRLSRRFSFEVEPDVRYYFNSVYESSQLSKKPWSVGVRAAFVITL